VSAGDSVIRVKAMLIASNADHTAHVVSLNAPTVENPQGFHRLIGGTVEWGESHVDTIRREVAEELGAVVRDLSLLTVVENIFTMNGALGHEIVFVYSGRLDPSPPAIGATLVESDGRSVPVVWRSVSGEGEELPLYPSGVDPWVRGLGPLGLPTRRRAVG
jgi:ADP-ribose pyrophosphatase YjhB (NUDIX family)